MKVMIIACILSSTATLCFVEPAPIVINPSYEHTKWGISPINIEIIQAAYTASFDSDDDNNGDGKSDYWGIPEWVSYEIKALIQDHPLEKRPTWMTDEDLYTAGIAPGDESYSVPGTNDLQEEKTDYRFVRGHMCPKETADRISVDAAYNTHILINAVPQLQW